jgi:hypothetical protein
MKFRRKTMMSKKFKLAITSAVVLTAMGVSMGMYLISGGSAQVSNPDEDVTSGSTFQMTDASMVSGGSPPLVRTKEGISASLQTSDLEPGNAYTMWWMIVNNPEKCEHPVPGVTSCGEGDVFAQPLGETPVKVSVQYADGNIVDETGTANFGAYLKEGEISEIPGQHVFGPELINAKKAEVHLVVRDHGPVIPEMEDAQLTTFGGACTAETDPTGVGPIGPNECADVQFAAHMPFQLR